MAKKFLAPTKDTILAVADSLQKIEQNPNLSLAQRMLLEKIILEGRVFPHQFEPDSEPLMILDVTQFLNHRVNTKLLEAIGQDLAKFLKPFHPEIILTAPSSGNIPAFTTAIALPEKPAVIYAPKGAPVTINDGYRTNSRSYTFGKKVSFVVSKACLPPGSRVAIGDDFLDTGRTVLDLINIVKQAQSQVAAVFFVIEKSFAGGRKELIKAGITNEKIFSLVDIQAMQPGAIKANGFNYWFSLKK